MIGKLIKELLTDNGSLTALVDASKIFPYVANENTNLPLIVYTIDSLTPVYNKDGWVSDNCSFSISSFSDDYSNLQDIVKEVRIALELMNGTDTKRIILTGQTEGYLEGVFGNKLNFEVDIINI